MTIWKKLTSILGKKPEAEPRPPDSDGPEPPEPPPPARTDEPIPGDLEFAVAIYSRLCAEKGNLFFSPFALRVALAMAHVGARGQTAREMEEVLRLPAAGNETHARLRAIIDAVRASDGEKIQVAAANALWRQEGAQFVPQFQKVIRKFYESPLYNVDFLGAAERAREWINRWAEDRTRGRIRDLCPPGAFDRLTRLVVTNADHFKGEWASPFEKNATVPLPFHPAMNHEIRTPMMYQEKVLPYAEIDEVQALQIPCAGGDIVMTLLLPRARWALARVEKRMTAERLAEWIGAMRETEVRVYLPKFQFSWESQGIPAALSDLGMRDAFHGSHADFSGMNGFRPPHDEAFHIGRVLHKAFVDASEEGKEAEPAAAVRAPAAGLFDAPQKIVFFRADHPFFFAVRHRPSGTILFLGRVANPAAT